MTLQTTGKCTLLHALSLGQCAANWCGRHCPPIHGILAEQDPKQGHETRSAQTQSRAAINPITHDSFELSHVVPTLRAAAYQCMQARRVGDLFMHASSRPVVLTISGAQKVVLNLGRILFVKRFASGKSSINGK